MIPDPRYNEWGMTVAPKIPQACSRLDFVSPNSPDDPRNLPLRRANCLVWHETEKHLSRGGIFNQAELYAEANDDSEYQYHGEILKQAHAAHRSRRPVEKEDDEHIEDADGAASDERNM